MAKDMLEARGVVYMPNKSWATRYIKYCAAHFGSEPGEELVLTVPRSLEQDRASVAPVRVARYFFKLFKVIDVKKPRALVLGDEAGYSGFWGMGLAGTPSADDGEVPR